MKDERTAAMLLACSDHRAIMPAGHVLINRHIKSLLADGLVTYAGGRRAYKLTKEGKKHVSR